MVVIVGAAGRFIAMLSACVDDCGVAALESVTFTVKFDVPFGPVGVPVITPAPLIASPGGSVPLLRENVSVPAPPDAVTVWL
jgi:hypothetical protein